MLGKDFYLAFRIGDCYDNPRNLASKLGKDFPYVASDMSPSIIF